jgi:hypothetical protein
MEHGVSTRRHTAVVAMLLVALTAVPNSYGQATGSPPPAGTRPSSAVAPKVIRPPADARADSVIVPPKSTPSPGSRTAPGAPPTSTVPGAPPASTVPGSKGDGASPPGTAPPVPGAAGQSQSTPTEGGRRSGGNLLPLAIGAAAIIAVGVLLAQERNPSSQPGPNPPPTDQIVERLRTEGPRFDDQFNMSAFAVRGFVRGGWPLLIDFEQRSAGVSYLRISARGLPEIFSYDLSEACPAPKRCLIQLRLPPEVFGDELRPAVIAATATDNEGKKTQSGFTVYALGAGPRAVGSVAVDQVKFGPATIRAANQQTALYRFYSHSDFSNTSVEFWKVGGETAGTKHSFVDDRRIEGGIQRNQWVGLNERREWDGKKRGETISAGRHKVQVRAWDRAGDWVTAWSDSMVMVAQ